MISKNELLELIITKKLLPLGISKKLNLTLQETNDLFLNHNLNIIENKICKCGCLLNTKNYTSQGLSNWSRKIEDNLRNKQNPNIKIQNIINSLNIKKEYFNPQHQFYNFFVKTKCKSCNSIISPEVESRNLNNVVNINNNDYFNFIDFLYNYYNDTLTKNSNLFLINNKKYTTFEYFHYLNQIIYNYFNNSNALHKKEIILLENIFNSLLLFKIEEKEYLNYGHLLFLDELTKTKLLETIDLKYANHLKKLNKVKNEKILLKEYQNEIIIEKNKQEFLNKYKDFINEVLDFSLEFNAFKDKDKYFEDYIDLGLRWDKFYWIPYQYYEDFVNKYILLLKKMEENNFNSVDFFKRKTLPILNIDTLNELTKNHLNHQTFDIEHKINILFIKSIFSYIVFQKKIKLKNNDYHNISDLEFDLYLFIKDNFIIHLDNEIIKHIEKIIDMQMTKLFFWELGNIVSERKHINKITEIKSFFFNHSLISDYLRNKEKELLLAFNQKNHLRNETLKEIFYVDLLDNNSYLKIKREEILFGFGIPKFIRHDDLIWKKDLSYRFKSYLNNKILKIFNVDIDSIIFKLNGFIDNVNLSKR